jgi:hypothetical protein
MDAYTAPQADRIAPVLLVQSKPPPLFTRRCRRGILGNSHAGSCIASVKHPWMPKPSISSAQKTARADLSYNLSLDQGGS